MKKIFLPFLLLLSFFCALPVKAMQFDNITNFKSEITINNDTSISIVETINYNTSLDKHGIYRNIPIRYNRNGLNYTAKVKNPKVIDGNSGVNIPFTTSYEDGFVVYKIGYPDKTFTGEKTYILSYNVENALHRYENHDELYWDITGEGWKIPILNTRAQVKSPHAKINTVVCYSGIFGSDDELCNFGHQDHEANFYYDKKINYGKNMTVAVALSQQDSAIVFPTKFEQILKTIKDNFFLLLIPLPILIMYLLWFFKGRDFMFVSRNVFNLDDKKTQQLRPLFYKHRTPMVYEPLKDLTPGEAGSILDERVDNQDIIAEIIDLARKKFIKIEKIEKKGFLSKSEDYKFTKLKEPSKSLPHHQEYLLEKIFKSKTEVKLSSLKGTFYNHMEKTKKLIDESLRNKKLFTHKVSNTRAGSIALAIFLSGLSFFVAIFATTYTYSPLPVFISVITGIICIVIGYQMPQKTAIGTNLMLQAKGLQRTIKLGQWREKIKEKNLFIEEILPFAISLGVVKQLAKDMEKLNIEAPKYLDNVTTLHHMNMASFVNSFSQQANSTLSYNPSSHSYSGGSGFSGGSSGGGGGGGGGGSW